MPALSRHEDIRCVATVRAQGVCDGLLVVADFVCVAMVRIGGVDERDARIESGVDRRDRAIRVRAALDRYGHAAESDR